MFNKAKWIWKDDKYLKNSYGWFFKYIDLEEEIINSTINITGHNHFKLIVNGEIVSGLVTPAPSTVTKDKLYLTYDLNKYLKVGRNKIEVIVLYLGGSGQNYINAIPGFIAQGVIETKNNEIEIISDDSFRVYNKTSYTDDMPFQQSRRITPVQYFDDRVILNDKDSRAPTVLNGYPKYRKQEIPEGGIHRTIEPTLLHEVDGVRVYDCGEIISGFVSIELKPKRDEEITIRYSEDLEGLRVKHNVANEYSEHYKDIFVVKKDKETSLNADFTYKAFRYFEIEGSISKIKAKAHKAGTAIDIVGSLSSKTNEEINQLFRMFKKTQKNNIQGLLVDCPHREQAQYLGDSALQAESIIYNVAQRKSLIEKVIADFAYAQYEDGTFPFVAPGSTGGEDFSLKIPEYDLYFVELIYERYLIDLDNTIYSKYEANLIKLLDQYINKIDNRGLVRKDKEWHISDWPYPTVDQEGEYLAFENMLLYKSLNMFSKMTTSKDKGEYYSKIAEQLKNTIIKEFKVNGLYKDCDNSKSYHQGIQAYALSCGLFKDDEIEKVLTYISGLKMSSSVILGRTVLSTLFEYKKTDEALAYMFDYEKGWGAILKTGSSTMWEGFDDIESHSHAWGMYPIRFMQEYLLGIKFDLKERDKIYINPQVTIRIKNLNGKILTERGLLEFEYNIIDNKVQFIYKIPDGLLTIFNYKDNHMILSGTNTFILNI